MDSRKQGQKLENYVAARLREVLKDESIHPTKASGASTQLGDILCSRFLIECKQRTTRDITIKEDVWNKLEAELPLGSIRIPLYILENKNKKRWAVLDVEDFFNLIKEK
jgi:hypothetical protein